MFINIDLSNVTAIFNKAVLLNIKLVTVGQGSEILFNDIIYLKNEKIKLRYDDDLDNKKYKLVIQFIQQGKIIQKAQYYFNFNFSDFCKIDNIIISKQSCLPDNYKDIKKIELKKILTLANKNVFLERNPLVVSREERADEYSIYYKGTLFFVSGALCELWKKILKGIFLSDLLTNDVAVNEKCIKRLNLLISKGVLIAYERRN